MLLLVRGFAIGSADLVPGVSGGTVALVTGIYPRLLAAIGGGATAAGRLMRGDHSGAARALRGIEWRFLVPVVAGAGLAVAALARMFEDVLRNYPVRSAAVFLGLIAGAVVVAWWLIRTPGMAHAVVAGAVGIVTFALFGFRTSVINDPDWNVFLGAGALAICAFILPGVSGSFLLLAIGMYEHVLGAISDFRLPSLAAFALGAAVGLAVFSRFLQWMLDRYHDLVVTAMIGLMIGSFRILWPWPAGLGDENGVGATTLGAPGPDIAIPVSLAVASAALVVGFAVRARRTPTTDHRPPTTGSGCGDTLVYLGAAVPVEGPEVPDILDHAKVEIPDDHLIGGVGGSTTDDLPAG